MQIYSAKLPVTEELTQDRFIQLVIDWNQGSPYNKINTLNWDGISHSMKFQDGNLSLEIEELRARNIIAVRFTQLDEQGIIWTTEIITDFYTKMLYMKLDRETTKDTSGYIPNFKAPYFMNLLLKDGYVAADGIFEVNAEPIAITADNLSLIENIINRKTDFLLPVVYVTKSWGEYLLDIKELAFRLRGVAHVLIEEESSVSSLLREKCDAKNPYFGRIGIYYPGNVSQDKILLANPHKMRDEVLLNKVVNTICRYVNQQARDPLYRWEGVQNEILTLKNQSLSEKHKRAEMEVDELYDSLDQELKDKDAQIEELNNKVMRLQSECQGLHAKLDGLDEVPMLYYGDEEELFEGEIRELILTVLKDQLKQCVPHSRRADVINDLLKNNDFEGKIDKKHEEIKQILKGYKSVNEPLKRALKEFGFEIKKDGSHYKLLYYGDSRYQFTMAGSGSDGQHGGGNLASVISNKIL